ncbi:MAG: O-antigen ligase family protein [Fimbriimonas sp.]
MSAVGAPYRARLIANAQIGNWKGLALSHLLGLVIASEFMVGAAAGFSIPYVRLPLFSSWLDFPVRVLALWLLVDRNWRLGRLRMGLFDVLILGYCGLVGLTYPYTAQDPSVQASFEWYRGFAGDMVRYYMIYLLVREGHNRAGFDGRIMLRWILAAMAFSASLAVAQAFNVGGVRMWSVVFYRQTMPNPNEPFRAAGTATHWNGFASTMVLATLLALAPLNYRRLRWHEYGIATLFIFGMVVSTSRGGYVTLGAVGLAAGFYFLWTRRPRTGWSLIGLIAVAAATFLVIVVTYNVPRFRDLVVPPKVQSADLGSFTYRLERARQLTDRGMDRPITGTGPSDTLWRNERMLVRSAASVEGILDASYPLVFAEFGMLGLAYMAGIIFSFLRYASRRRAVHPYAALAFLTGVAFAVHSVTEMLLRAQVMVLVSLVAGLAASRVIVRAHEFGERRPEPARLPGRVRGHA